jgi:hypothetical protein
MAMVPPSVPVPGSSPELFMTDHVPQNGLPSPALSTSDYSGFTFQVDPMISGVEMMEYEFYHIPNPMEDPMSQYPTQLAGCPDPMQSTNFTMPVNGVLSPEQNYFAGTFPMY